MLWKRRTGDRLLASGAALPDDGRAEPSIDCLRNRKSRGEDTCGLDTLDGYVRCLVADRCEEEFDLSWLRHEIDDGVSQLSEQCRRVFLLSRVTGLKNREIAERLNISVKAVEKHIGVALSEAASQAEPQRFLQPVPLTAYSFSEDPPPIPVASWGRPDRMVGPALFPAERTIRPYFSGNSCECVTVPSGP